MTEPLAYARTAPSDRVRQSWWGIGSFVCSCLVLAALAAAVIANMLRPTPEEGAGRPDLTAELLWLIGGWVLSVLLGAVSLFQYERKQQFAAWGLILAAVAAPVLLITAGLVWGRFD